MGLAHPVHRQRQPSASSAGSCAAASHESERGPARPQRSAPPLLPSLLADWRPIVQTFGIVAMTNAAYYLTFTFAVERRKHLTGEGGRVFLLANTLSLFVVLFAKPLGGWLSDLVGRRRLMIALTVATMALVYVALQADAVRVAGAVHRSARS